VRHPAGLRERLAAFGDEGLDAAFDLQPLEGPSTGTDLADDIDITHAVVPHMPGTYATRIDVGGRSLCFGADCAPCEELPALARGVDLLVAECSFGDGEIPEGVPHLNGTEAGRIARAAGAGRLLLTHGLPEYDRDAAAAMAAEAAGVPAAWAVQDRTEHP
jgi:ribonuclease BN (tRNA processing enzyme)